MIGCKPTKYLLEDGKIHCNDSAIVVRNFILLNIPQCYFILGFLGGIL